MCDQTPVEYNCGDIVWVKLGPCWWPAEVYDMKKLPQDVIDSFKKPPIFVVKFFNEDKFEYIKTIEKIYLYNCTKKNDFIKKGLALYRSKTRIVMDKFLADVTTAETKTNGDPDILHSPLFSPEVKPDYSSIFKSTKSKVSTKSRTNTSLSSSFGSASPATSTPNKSVIKPYFVKSDECDIRILIQSPPEPDVEKEQEEETYLCPLCGFQTCRVNLFIMHNKSHIQGMYDTPTSPTRKRRSSPKKRTILRMTKSDTSSLLEDLQLIEQGSLKATESSDDDDLSIKKPRIQVKRKKICFRDAPVDKKEPPRTDIRHDLLAEWDDESDGDKDINLSTNITDSSQLSTDNSICNQDELKNNSDSDQKLVELDLKIPETSKSCFDFEEEEEDEILSTSIGRKIPRVIPPTEWPKIVLDPDFSDEETEKTRGCITDKEDTDKKYNEPDVEAFENLLDTTTVPQLPKIPDLISIKKDCGIPSDLPVIQKNDCDIDDNQDLDESHNMDKNADDNKEQNRTSVPSEEIQVKDNLILGIKQVNEVSLREVECNKDETELNSKLVNVDCEKSDTFVVKEQQMDFNKEGPETDESILNAKQGNASEKNIPVPETYHEDTENSVEIDAAFNEHETDINKKEAAAYEFFEKQKIELVEDENALNEVDNIMNNEDRATVLDIQEDRRSSARDAHSPSDEFTISIQDKPLSLIEENLLASIEEKSIINNEYETCPSNDKGTSLDIGIESVVDVSECHKDDSLPSKDQNVEDQVCMKSEVEHLPKPFVKSTREQLLEEPFSNEKHTQEITPSFDIQPLLIKQDSADVIDESKPINPKKRFVRTFEHFEQLQVNEQKKLIEQVPESTNDVVNIFNLKSQIMSKMSSGREQPIDRKHSPKHQKPKTFRELILEHRRKEDDANSLDLDLSEVPKKILDSPLHEGLDDSFNLDSSEFLDDTNTSGSIENKESEPALNLVMQSIDDNVSQQELISDINRDLFVESSDSTNEKNFEESILHLNHAVMMELGETLPESQIDNQVDEFVSILPHSTNEELHQTTVECELNNRVEEYQTCVSISCSEKSGDMDVLSPSTKVEHNSREAELFKNADPDQNFLTEIDSDEASKLKSSLLKPLSVANFSVDFPDLKETKTAESDIVKHRKGHRKKEEPDLIERSLGRVFADEINTESDSSNSAQQDIEDRIPSVVVCNASVKVIEKPEYVSSSKLLEILTDGKSKPEVPESTFSKGIDIKSDPQRNVSKSDDIVQTLKPIDTPNKSEPEATTKLKRSSSKFDPKHTKFVIKSASGRTPLVVGTHEEVSVQKVSTLKPYEDVDDDIDAFIIQKPGKISANVKEDRDNVPSPMLNTIGKKIIQPSPARGKAKILQQTIIKPANDAHVMSSVPNALQIVDDSNMFDINSMPIVLSDQILSPESIENMSVTLPDSVSTSTVIKNVSPASTSKQTIESIKLINKPAINSHPILIKTYSNKNANDNVKALSSLRTARTPPSIISRSGTSEKFIIVKTASASPMTTKASIKRPAMLKKSLSVVSPSSATPSKTSTACIPEPTGNKIMIVTNQQGQQSRVLLTPEQQKLLGYQGTGNKLVKSTIKGNILPKSLIIKPAITTISSTKPNVLSSSVITTKGEIVSSIGQNLLTSERKMILSTKIEPKIARKLQISSPKPEVQPGPPRTIVIKNPHGHVVKKVLGSDDALLEQQVQEQVNAIKASGSFAAMKAKQEVPKQKLVQKRPIGKKIESGPQRVSLGKSQTFFSLSQPAKIVKTETPPPLTPIPPKKSDALPASTKLSKVPDFKAAMKTALKDSAKKVERPSTQNDAKKIIIRDNLGHQTTLAKGQILAVPSGETVDGETQSYIIVTMDGSGSLTTLSKEELLSLDPNLTLDSDLGTVVMQGDSAEINQSASEMNDLVDRNSAEPELSKTTNEIASSSQTIQTVCNLTVSDSMINKQLIITGDPISTQRFLQSLSEGNQDLANILATAEGNILLQTDEQQLLINTTDARNQSMVPAAECTQETGGLLYTNPPLKSQDILAAALADTDVFQQDLSVSPIQDMSISSVQDMAMPSVQDMSISSAHNKLSQLSPNTNTMYQNTIANVLETTLSLSSPIMTPLEVPSTNIKKTPDSEIDIFTKSISKNVLPVTITDPNIVQAGSQQPTTSSSLDIPLTVSDPGGVPLNSMSMNSSSFVYSLPTLDEQQKLPRGGGGPISMPLLNEDSQTGQLEKMEHGHDLSRPSKNLFVEKGNGREFLVTLDPTNADELLDDDLCNSLSEPPSDMFYLADLTTDYRGMEMKQGATSHMLRPELLKLDSKFSFSRNGRETPPSISAHVTSSPSTNIDDNSCEIPVQPSVGTDLSSSHESNESDGCSKRTSNDDSNGNDKKKIKID